jgi:hypothetical protein
MEDVCLKITGPSYVAAGLPAPVGLTQAKATRRPQRERRPEERLSAPGGSRNFDPEHRAKVTRSEIRAAAAAPREKRPSPAGVDPRSDHGPIASTTRDGAL